MSLLNFVSAALPSVQGQKDVALQSNLSLPELSHWWLGIAIGERMGRRMKRIVETNTGE